MSARVFNPSAAMELRRAVRGGLPPAEPASVPAPVVDSIRRNLFGPVDHEESRRFVQRQLEEIEAKEMEFYGFNFREGKPLDGPPRRFAWTRVTSGSVPKAYALSRLAYLSGATAEAQEQHHQQQQLQLKQQELVLLPQQQQQQDQQPQQKHTAPVSKSEAAAKPGPSSQPPCTPASSKMRQKRMEDFMPTRKRAGSYIPSTTKTKTTTTTTPATTTASSSSTECGGGSDAKQRKFSTASV